MTNKRLKEKATLLKELRIEAERLDRQIDELESEIKAEMTATNKDELLIGTVKITWKAYTSQRFDSKAFKLAHEKLYNKFCKKLEIKRFIVA